MPIAYDKLINKTLLHQHKAASVDGIQVLHGIDDLTESTISYDEDTQTITVTPTGTTFTYYIHGVKYQSGEIEKTHTNASGFYYLYIRGSDNTVQFTTDAWSILDDVLIAGVYFEATQTNGVAFDERHSATRNLFAHYELHYTIGAYWHPEDGGLALGDYTVQPTIPADSDNQWSLSASDFHDEDLEHEIPATAVAGPYLVAYRDGGSGIWKWETNNVPLLAGTYIYYNQLTGGSWTRTELATNQYVNYYIIHLNSVEEGYRTAIIMGQQVFATQAAAQAGSLNDITWGAFPDDELISSYKITFRTGAAYTTEGKCRISVVTDTRRSTNAQLVASAPGQTHNSLSGLQGGTTNQYYHLTAADYAVTPWTTAPTADDSTGTAGQRAYDDHYLYICTATDTWNRVRISGFEYLLTEGGEVLQLEDGEKFENEQTYSGEYLQIQ